MNDTIADMLTRIRNASHAKHKTVDVKFSRICLGIAQVLKDEGYVREFVKLDDGTHQGLIRLTLKYSVANEPAVRFVARASRPGCRVYRGVGKLPRVIQGMGISILSTSRGVLSNRQAVQQNIGGELLATVH